MYNYRKQINKGGVFSFLMAVAGFAIAICLFTGLFWWYGQSSAAVDLQKTYYFLVRECEDTTAAAVAGQVYVSGGAGYFIEVSGTQYVAIACYFEQSAAQTVQETLSEKGIQASVSAMSTKQFDVSDKSKKQKIIGQLETVESCARILYDTANGLERTDYSQDEARERLRGAITSLGGLSIDVPSWNAALYNAERRGAEIAEGILFAKDLRYLQIELCMLVLKADTYFS